MIKQCTRCKSFNEFPENHPKRKGYWCKPCLSKAAVESAKKNRETKRKNNQDYAARNSSNRASATAKWRSNHPEKKAAHQAVQTALRNGTLKRHPCEVCGDNFRIHAHHEDYAKKLDVNWLCHKHHMERHLMLEARK